ncbi:SdpI family protein [Culicoidibacter larvae]|nr:SdpI family protein [Culicoidibacter larvae]
MKKNNIELVNYFLIGISVAMSAISYPFLPDSIPIHWNYNGVVDEYGSKLIVLSVIPIGIFLLYLLLRYVPRIDPRKKNYERFSRTYSWFRVSILMILVVLQGVTILVSFGLTLNMGMIIQIGLGALFIFLGNLMPKIQPTYFVGIRTPWTLANDKVWHRTHQLAGKVWVICGFLMIPLALIPVGFIQFAVLIVLIVVMVLVPTIYSYYIYKKN